VFLCSAVVTVSLAAGALAGPPRAEQGTRAEANTPDRPAPPRDDGAWTVSVGTGAGALVELDDGFVGAAAAGGSTTQRGGRIQANVRAARDHGRWIRTGIAYTHQRWKKAYSAAGAPQGTIRDSVHVVLADLTLRWVRGRDVELYSAVAAGGAVWRERGTLSGTRYDGEDARFAFQLRLLGLSLGGERVRAFAEVGLGYEGLLVGGLALRF
jgi:hypothetical protein